MNVFGIGLPEMALIMVIALLVFGPKKLPEIGRSMGKALKSFQEASKEFENEFKKEADRINETLNETPMEATLETPKAQDQPQPQLEGQEMAEAPTDEVMADSPEVTNS
ncbi:TatA/E family twin arginine-targeting protein translocase [Acaryochloris sp. 'Moss Beach']|uniref:TatA/E family twin arginine-targeting protein translocase n=1 Tax=Acaryochloris TaxID=155977 RepID=UPI001F37AD05|nr:TatA/E family twin arginine-targeting protein translocase [Acaryochloris sp. 'Moss Beach']UJB69957.1 TatA/E family twin arginine-targeting protein translocase [Acaryochloris sp. 'Moss Beach']